MPVPSFDFPGANGELINLKDWRVVQRPNRIEDLTQCAALVMECRSRPDLNSIDQFQNRLPSLDNIAEEKFFSIVGYHSACRPT